MSVKNSCSGLVSSKYIYRVVSLLLMICSFNAEAIAQKQKKKHTSVEYKLTVASISPSRDDSKYVEVTFLESSRFYKINKKSKKNLDILAAGQKDHKQVWVKRANEYSDVILRVKKVD